MYVFALFLLLFLLLSCSVFFSLFPAPCYQVLLNLPFAFGKYSGHLANVRKITQKSEPCLSQASFRPRRGQKDKRLHNVALRNSFLFFPHTHFLWGEKGHRQGTYRESSLRGLLINYKVLSVVLVLLNVFLIRCSSSIWASRLFNAFPAFPIRTPLFFPILFKL